MKWTMLTGAAATDVKCELGKEVFVDVDRGQCVRVLLTLCHMAVVLLLGLISIYSLLHHGLSEYE